MLNFQYDPDLTIRGLHYDITNGLLIKVNAVLQIQSDAVFRGKYINARTSLNMKGTLDFDCYSLGHSVTK